MTNKGSTLGQLSRRESYFPQAIEANYYLEQNHTPYTLIERLKETNSYTMADWIDDMKFNSGNEEGLADIRIKRTNQLITTKRMGGLILQKISTQPYC